MDIAASSHSGLSPLEVACLLPETLPNGGEPTCPLGCAPCKWIGPTCQTCGGDGKDRFAHPEHGDRCRTCWGHGRDAA